jgi:hypothetical protein
MTKVLCHRWHRASALSPWATLRQKIRNVANLLSPRIAPSEISSATTRVRIVGDTVAGVDDSVPRRLHRDAVLWSIVVTFVVNAIYVPATRYTAPMQFVFIFYSAVALARLREGS